MTEYLNDESRNALIEYRLQRAFETLEEADYNSKGGYYNTAVNRLYYSAFYAANALLLSKGISCETHKGVKSMISLHFVRNGILDIEDAKSLNQLFQNRQSGDYEDFTYCDLELYNILRPKAESFIIKIRDILTH